MPKYVRLSVKVADDDPGGDPPASEASNERTVLRDDPQRGADLAGGDLAAGRDLEADGLARAPVAARRRPRPRDGRRARAARGTARSSSSRSRTRRSCSASTSARGSCAGRSATWPATCARARTSSSATSSRTRRSRRSPSFARRSWRRPGSPEHLLDGAVVGVPGAVDDATGQLSMATNVPGLEGRDFRDELDERLGLPVTLDNDINLAARGEQWLGVARGVDDFVFLSIGTGLGAGLVLRGELHRGRNGAAGEVDLVASGRTRGDRPLRRRGLGARRAARRRGRHATRARRRPTTRARCSPPPAPATRSAREVVEEEAQAHRAAHRSDRRRHRRRARRPRRRDRRERRPAPRPDPRPARRVAAVPAAGRGLGLGDAAVLTGRSRSASRSPRRASSRTGRRAWRNVARREGAMGGCDARTQGAPIPV